VLIAALSALLLLALPAAPSYASEHTVPTAEYGKDGTLGVDSGFSGCRIAYDSASKHLYIAGDGKIYGLAVTTPGTATPLPGFPIEAGLATYCGEPAFGVDDSGNGHIFYVTSGKVGGWEANGEELPAPFPLTTPNGSCGVEGTSNGEVWVGNDNLGEILKFTAAGVPNGSIKIGFGFCKFTIDHSNGNIYVAPYGGSPGRLVEFTAASGYSIHRTLESTVFYGNPGLAVNGKLHKLYVGFGGANIDVYDTETGEPIESIPLPGTGGEGLAVDEATDTVFSSVGGGGGPSTRVVEYEGVETPLATTGEPTAGDEVSGTADPNGVGPITECYFEYGTTTAYGEKQNCTEGTPISSKETVHAVLPGLTTEQTYHYRLVVWNGQPGATDKGKDQTITPHYVKGLYTEPATEITQESAMVNARFEGTGEDTHYYFEWGQTASYGHKTPLPPGDDAGSPSGLTTVSTELTGLEPGLTYHYRVVAENQLGESKANDRTFTTFELPAIESATTSHLASSSAEVDAKINPHGFETTYYVEYGTTNELGSIAPVPAGTLPAVSGSQSVAIPLPGLQEVTYYFRLVAESKWGRVATEEQSFNFSPQPCPNAAVRQQDVSQYLPDCRAYELVSPDEIGDVELVGSGPPGPDADNRFFFGGFYGGLLGTEPTNGISEDHYLAVRTDSGWTSRLVGFRGFETASGSNLVGNTELTKFMDFIEHKVFEGEPQPDHNLPHVWDSEGNPLGVWPANFESIPNSELTKGAVQPSPDFSHVAISSTNVAFTSEGRTTGAGSAYDYDPSTGSMALISLDAENNPIELEPGDSSPRPAVGIYFPGAPLKFNFSELSGQGPRSINPSVSTDGSHILMGTSSAPIEAFTNPLPPMHLYMRVNDAITYDVSQGHDVSYIGMTADGSKVFFTSTERLTSEDTDNSADLYMWSQAGDKLTLLSKGGEGAQDSGNSDACSASWVSGCGVAAVAPLDETDSSIASESGEIYFYSPEQLDGNKGIANRENLYVYREGAPRFVASLDPSTGANTPVKRIQVSPDGAHMAFTTATHVTGYNSLNFEEMYDYNPVDRSVVCVSCRPDGEPPTVNVEGSQTGLFMSNDGRTFFSTEDPLVPTDTNEHQDVYEYAEGRPQLITSGVGVTEHHSSTGFSNFGSEGLDGVSADGADVFFASRDVLVPQNHNGPVLAFYDARTNGGFPYEPPLAPCEAADECHGAGNPPPARPTVTSEGSLGSRGNAANPQKHKHTQHRKKHKKKKKHQKAKRANRSRHDRGGKNHA
jgi:hypothetical protein